MIMMKLNTDTENRFPMVKCFLERDERENSGEEEEKQWLKYEFQS